MPITPLHMAIGGMASSKSWILGFGITQVLIDLDVIMTVVFDLPRPLHGTTHTLVGALGIALLWCVISGNWRRYIVPAIVGAVSHVLLDSIVHIDVVPFWPLFGENPLHIPGSIEIVSQLCLALLGVQMLFLGISKSAWRAFENSRW